MKGAVRFAAFALAAGSVAAAPTADGPMPQFGVFVAPGGEALDAEWHLPAGPEGEVRALITLQHGFARRCANLRSLARAFAQAGFATLCVNADMARGAAPLAQALAAALHAAWQRDGSADALAPGDAGAVALVPPDGRALPARVLVAGHSAGGLFAAHLGAALAQRAPERLAGALLFDPVGGDELARALVTLRGDVARPVLALLAPPTRCNAQQLARPALSSAAGGASIVDLADGTHLDAEGEDTEAIAVWACREGWPRAEVVQRLRETALVWALRATGPAINPRNVETAPRP